MISIATYAPMSIGHVAPVRARDFLLVNVEKLGLPADDVVNLFADMRGAMQ